MFDREEDENEDGNEVNIASAEMHGAVKGRVGDILDQVMYAGAT